MIARNVQNIKSQPPGGWGESTALLRATGHQTQECKGRKGINSEPDGVTAPSGWLWTGYSTKVCKRRQARPAYAGYIVLSEAGGRPKRERFQGRTSLAVYSLPDTFIQTPPVPAFETQ